jgi:hypothetical protein
MLIERTNQNEIYYHPLKKENPEHIGELISSQSTVRESMAALPALMQPFLTWLTSVPLKTQTRSYHNSGYHLMTAMATFIFGVIFAYLGQKLSHEVIATSAMFILSSAFSLSAIRKLQIVIIHHCSHSNFFSRKSIWIYFRL